MPTTNYNYSCQNATQANPKNVCRTDNASTGWWMEGNIDFTTSANDTTAETSINLTMNNSYDGTDLNTFYDSTPCSLGPVRLTSSTARKLQTSGPPASSATPGATTMKAGRPTSAISSTSTSNRSQPIARSLATRLGTRSGSFTATTPPLHESKRFDHGLLNQPDQQQQRSSRQQQRFQHQQRLLKAEESQT